MIFILTFSVPNNMRKFLVVTLKCLHGFGPETGKMSCPPTCIRPIHSHYTGISSSQCSLHWEPFLLLFFFSGLGWAKSEQRKVVFNVDLGQTTPSADLVQEVSLSLFLRKLKTFFLYHENIAFHAMTTYTELNFMENIWVILTRTF